MLSTVCSLLSIALTATPQSDYDQANRLIQAGRPNAAILQLRSALDQYSDNDIRRFSLNTLLADAYRITRNDKLAAATLEVLLAERPDSAELHFKLAAVYRSLGSLDAAIDEYKRGLEAGSSRQAGQGLPHCYGVALIEISKTLLQIGKASDAVPWLKEYVRLRPDDAEGYAIFGQAFVSMGRLSEAIPMLSMAVHLKPADSDVRYRFAMALWKAGDREKALHELEAAEAHAALARLWRELGDADRARSESALAER